MIAINTRAPVKHHPHDLENNAEICLKDYVCLQVIGKFVIWDFVDDNYQ